MVEDIEEIAESIEEVRAIGCGSGLWIPIEFVIIVAASGGDALGGWEMGTGDEALRS